MSEIDTQTKKLPCHAVGPKREQIAEADLHARTVALVRESGILDGTDTLYTVCRLAIVEGEGTPERVREIWREATEEWAEGVWAEGANR